ncbi:MAG: carbohydrate ABC transporter permease [Acidipropionibacterium acidipropionici]|jgi:multiple sugar transport system permease protein|uniref:ABC transporter permease n=2 Tax=Acidipropionibacterium acidipropionici TaxID=1748 RepID=A0AAC8YET8_9ACTN|nr:carbohydrate ABC transporter permease [Acidipropionibacterium acidipropionici]AMS04757.1 ABC transporter permease [Acidipropionibacterium acidipropionici]AOZ46247.1 ABC transporter permease [Acidipropionibacterium acidipropionici]AZP37726.1 carbohydrate ABC transporter permease [Acidipropionibacterium acidipropionici]MDN6556870.1 carbohydrate ABC transporter permease [Acidipropionibacterium acidipropionici]
MKPSATSRTVYYAVTALMAIVFILPLVWAVVSSISPNPGTAQTSGFGLGNYGTMLKYGLGIPVYLKNSIIVSVSATVFTLIVAATGGYAFARFTFVGKNVLFTVVLSVMMVPYAALLIPLLVWMKQLHLQNSLIGVALVLTLFQLPFSIFMMRNSFAAIPRELEEAAYMDGCGSFAAFLRVMLPSVRPGLVTVGLFTFLAAWNDFMVSLYLLSTEKAPLPLALVNMRQQTMGVIDYGSTTAGVVVLTLPAVVLFLALQRYYIQGFTSGAVKG